VLVSGRGEKHGALDDALVAQGRTRRVGIVVPSFVMVLPLLENSDYIAMLPSRCVTDEHRPRLVTLDPPIPIEGFTLHLAWHARHDGDMAVKHVAQAIQAALGVETRLSD